ncbi:hypothetical protein IAQ61_011626 [Plenodomus lingam]|uniref:uncharacterized protein n=1 Tax=Leptosphaeria maculans TaxID=5022 RepID=UPI0033207279|nr:hypothetical protein IAQ61_011626 [Plenodomus lingam]
MHTLYDICVDPVLSRLWNTPGRTILHSNKSYLETDSQCAVMIALQRHGECDAAEEPAQLRQARLISGSSRME